MNSKKKLWLSIASLCLVIVIGVTSVAVVFAALSANVNNNFEIHYTAHNVKASLIGSYSVGGTTTVMNVGGRKGIITYEGTESEDKTFDDIGSFDIEAGQSVEIDYTILNYDEKELPVSATLVNAPTNLNVTYETSIFNGETTTDASTTLTPSTPSSAINVPYSNGETITNACDALDAYYAQKCAEANPNGYLKKSFIGIAPAIYKKTAAVASIIYLFAGASALATSTTSTTKAPAPTPSVQCYLETPPGPTKTFSADVLGTEMDKNLTPFIVGNISMSSEVKKFLSYFKDFFNTIGKAAISNVNNYSTWGKGFSNVCVEILTQIKNIMGNRSDPIEVLRTCYNLVMSTDIEKALGLKHEEYDDNLGPLLDNLNGPETTLDALTWFNDCKAVGVPCAHIKIKFEIADPTQPASFNGGLNLKLGQL